MARRKRVQVGWFCDHDDEPFGAGSHTSTHGRMKRGKWHETLPEPNTRKALAFLDYRDPKKKPHCPRAVPMYVYREPADG